MRILVAALALAALAARLPAAGPFLTVSTSERSFAFSAQDFAGLHHVELTTVNPHDKAPHRYSGVPVLDLLSGVGVHWGEALHGSALGMGVVAASPDGYRVLFALAEFDPLLSDRLILVADRVDGVPIDAKHGPLQLIVPGDRRGARWAHNVVSLTVVSAGPAASPPPPKAKTAP